MVFDFAGDSTMIKVFPSFWKVRLCSISIGSGRMTKGLDSGALALDLTASFVSLSFFFSPVTKDLVMAKNLPPLSM